ncbi:DUF1638 domain-containing protein [Halomicrococcus gelatinilyticus]|uniref:DUF1638 domain-containing protein n=1 Tax=Halomicrococcus gelatinilyticus TaxID=1702103 RepID=UPI002E116DD3
MIGVVACEALYNVIERHAPEATVRYVPPDRHEFPVNVPDETAVSRVLQRRIEAVDDPSLDRIVVAYADDGENLTGLRSGHAPLVVARSADCLSTFLPESGSGVGSERKEFGTYYLSRGWIDCAVDSYKLHCAYVGGERDLVDRFGRAESSHDDLRFTWNEGKLYERALDAQERVTGDQVGRFVHRIVQYYDTVTLLDTGDLYPLHHEYAERFRAFLERLSRDHGDGHEVELTVTDADDAALGALLSSDPDEVESGRGERYPPGTPVVS